MKRIIIKKIGKSYLMDGMSYDYRINGKEYKDVKKVWFDEEPKIIEKIRDDTKIVAYGDLTPEEYETRVEELLKELKFTEDEWGNKTFDELEDEYKYKKFVKEHHPKYESYRVYVSLEIIIYDITGRTDISYIVPNRYIGKEEIDINKKEILYNYFPDPPKMFQEIAEKYGFTKSDSNEIKKYERKYFMNGQKNIKYDKISNFYFNVDTSDFYGLTGSWKECFERYSNHYNIIENRVKEIDSIIRSRNISLSISDALERLIQLRNTISNLRVYAKFNFKKDMILDDIRRFIDELSGAIDENRKVKEE